MEDGVGGRFGWWLSFRRDGRHLGHAIVATRGSVAAAIEILRTTGGHPAPSAVVASEVRYDQLARLPAHVLAALVTLPRATLLREPRAELAAVRAAIACDERRATSRPAALDAWVGLRTRGDAAIERMYALREALALRRVEFDRLRRTLVAAGHPGAAAGLLAGAGRRLSRAVPRR